MTIVLTSRRLARLSPLFAGLALTACGAEPPTQPGGSGSAEMTMIALSSTEVAKVSVTVVGPALPSPRVSSLFRTAGQWGAQIGGLPAGAGYSVTAAAQDASGGILYTGSASNVTIVKDQTAAVVITAQPTAAPGAYRNAVPVFDSLVVSSVAVGLGQEVFLTVTAHDPNSPDSVAFQWSATCGTFSDVLHATTTWTAPMTGGSCALTIKASDTAAATATASVTVDVDGAHGKGLAQVAVAANTWPVIADLSIAPNGWLVPATPTVLSVAASDSDDDPLSFVWSCTCAGDFSAATVASPTFALAVGQTGLCKFTVMVSDGRGGATTGDVTVPVGEPTIESP